MAFSMRLSNQVHLDDGHLGTINEEFQYVDMSLLVLTEQATVDAPEIIDLTGSPNSPSSIPLIDLTTSPESLCELTSSFPDDLYLAPPLALSPLQLIPIEIPFLNGNQGIYSEQMDVDEDEDEDDYEPIYSPPSPPYEPDVYWDRFPPAA